jgi:hypothetical protein
MKMKQFLDHNLDYSSVGGAVMAVWEYGSIVAGSWAYKKTIGYHNKGINAFERIKYHTGNGVNPTTSFFTCNMSRTENIISCLNLYAESPVLATDSISVLTICAAGKSYYLNDLYWIRNWNEFPKSHKGWDRSIYLHDWWVNSKGTKEWNNFHRILSDYFLKTYQNQDFEKSWRIILDANRILQPRVGKNKYKNNYFHRNSHFAKRIIYFVKKIFRILNISTYEEIIITMGKENIFVNIPEAKEAAKIVSQLYPYKNW